MCLNFLHKLWTNRKGWNGWKREGLGRWNDPFEREGVVRSSSSIQKYPSTVWNWPTYGHHDLTSSRKNDQWDSNSNTPNERTKDAGKRWRAFKDLPLLTFAWHVTNTACFQFVFSLFQIQYQPLKETEKNKRGNDLNTLGWKCCISLKPDSTNKGFETRWEIRFLPFLSCFCHRKKATLYICHWNIGTEQNM